MVQYRSTGGYGAATAPPAATRSFSWGEIPAGPTPIVTCLADVQPEEVRWLWAQRIPLASCTLLYGEPGKGKSFVTLDMAARVSSGAPWPDEDPSMHHEPGSVVILTTEDKLSTTVRPRLDAAGANPSKVHRLQGSRVITQEGKVIERAFALDDIGALEQIITGLGDTKLVIIDPVTGFMGDTDSHKNADVRGVLSRLTDLADRTGVAMVLISHMNKSTLGNAQQRANGSIAFLAVARSAYIVLPDKRDKRRRLMLPTKNNLSPDDIGGLAYRLIDGKVEWEADPVLADADELLADTSTRGERPRDECKQWIRDRLSGGVKVESKVIESEAAAAGYPRATLNRAKKEMGGEVCSVKSDFGRGAWAWTMAPKNLTPPRCDNVSTYGTSEHLSNNPSDGG